MKKIWETGVILFAAMGFWGMIYPDLCFTQDVCRVVYVDTYGNVQDAVKAEDAGSIGNAEDIGNTEATEDLLQQDMFTQLSNAKPGQIRVKSAFIDYFFGSRGEEGKDDSGQGADTPKNLKETASITESKGNGNGSNKGNKGSQ